MATFNFTFDPGTTLQQMIGFEIAGRVWANYLTDNTTINIHAGISSNLGTNVIGGALPGMQANVQYQTYRDRFAADRKSADDNTAYSNLYWNPAEYQATGRSPFFKSWIQTVDSYRPGGGSETITSQSLNMTRANAKALGITTTGASSALDGVILMGDLANSAVRWNYDYARTGSTPPSNTLDFLSTAIHEIGHVLGFISGQDQPFNHAAVATLNWTEQVAAQMTRIGNTTPLDFYRFQWWEATSSKAPHLIGIPNFTYGDIGKFSIDGGRNRIMGLSQGTTLYSAQTNGWSWGDGYQSSHTERGTNSIFSPTLSLQQQKSITQTDLRIFDVLGWDVNSNRSLSVNYTALATQSQQALATRLGKTVSWLNTNATTAATSLSKNRDQEIYTMMQNSGVYDLTRVAKPSSTGWVSRQVLAQAFQERGLFDTFDGSGQSNEEVAQPLITVTGELASDRQFTNPAASTPQLLNTAGAIAATTTRITQIYQENFTTDVPTPSPNLQTITIEVSAQTVRESQNMAVRLGENLASSSRAYSSELPYFTPLTSPTTTAEFSEFSVAYDNLLLASLTAI
jgi:hypothetical protein